MQVALEKELRLSIQVLAAKADLSMKNWILDNILSVHRRAGIESYLLESYGSLIILAPPTNAERFNIRVDNPVVDNAITTLAEKLQRTKPQIIYTLITSLVNEKSAGISADVPLPARSLIA